MAFTCATIRGGKSRGTASAREFFQPREAFSEEPFPPLAHDLSRQVQAFADLLVLEALGSHEHDLGSDDISIW
jgi:hypothetical protein